MKRTGIRESAALNEWKNGWPLVISSMFGMSIGTILIYTSGIFMRPIEAEFGWSRTEIASGLLITSVIGLIFAPAIGGLTDRFGPRRIALPGIVLYGCILAAFSTATSSLVYWRLLWLGAACAMVMLSPTVWATAVSSRFDHSRGLALALTLSGSGLTGVFAPALAGLILAQYGWRLACVALAVVWTALCLPVVLASFYGATDLSPDIKSTQIISEKPEHIGLTRREALRGTQFYRLAVAVLLVMLVLSGLLVHIVPIFVGAGISPVRASSIASMIGLATITGRLATGYLLDRFDGRWVGSAFFCLPVVLMLTLLTFDGTTAMALLVATLLGLCSGAEFDIAAYLTSRYFGMKNYGSLFGIITGLLSLAMGLGPTLYATVYDHFHAYTFAFYVAIPTALTAALLIATLGKCDPDFSRPG